MMILFVMIRTTNVTLLETKRLLSFPQVITVDWDFSVIPLMNA